MDDRNRQVLLKRRPLGAPSSADFEIADTPIPEPSDGEVLVRGIYLSLDPICAAGSAEFAPMQSRWILAP
jgi:NADPH-dependent curcumin reductase